MYAIRSYYVEQVLTNLVGNALRYTTAEATVTVRARVEGDRVRLELPAPRDLGPLELRVEGVV